MHTLSGFSTFGITETLPVQVIATVLAILLVSAGLVILAWPAIMRLGRASVRSAQHFSYSARASATPSAPAPVPALLPARLSRDAQWDRATDVVAQSIARVAAVHELQRSAEQQLDAATYAIQRLFDELSGVMTLQPGVPAATVVAGHVVHPFTPAAPRRDVSDAIAA